MRPGVITVKTVDTEASPARVTAANGREYLTSRVCEGLALAEAGAAVELTLTRSGRIRTVRRYVGDAGTAYQRAHPGDMVKIPGGYGTSYATVATVAADGRTWTDERGSTHDTAEILAGR